MTTKNTEAVENTAESRAEARRKRVIVVTLLHAFSIYNVGETCGLPIATALELMQSGWAKPLDDDWRGIDPKAAQAALVDEDAPPPVTQAETAEARIDTRPFDELQPLNGNVSQIREWLQLPHPREQLQDLYEQEMAKDTPRSSVLTMIDRAIEAAPTDHGTEGPEPAVMPGN